MLHFDKTILLDISFWNKKVIIQSTVFVAAKDEEQILVGDIHEKFEQQTREPWNWDWQKNRKFSYHTCPAHHSSMGEPQTLYQGKAGSIQCLRHQYTALWEWDMDSLCQAGKET